MTKTDELRRIRDVRVVRMNYGIEDEHDSIAIGFDAGGDSWFFEVEDVLAYKLIRSMTDTLFDIDPPRSGVGSPEGAARPM
jgi:hypothetical protein